MSIKTGCLKLFSGRAAQIAWLYLVFALLWIFASDRLLNLALDDPNLLLMISTGKGFAFVVVTTLLLYLLLKNWDVAAPPPTAPPAPPRIRNLAALFLGFSLIVPLLALGIVRIHGPQLRSAAFNDLRAIAALKSGQIEAWLQERQNDAEVLVGAEAFATHADRLTRNGDPQSRDYLTKRLTSLTKAWGFDSAIVLDARGQPLLAVGPHSKVPVDARERLLPVALASAQVQRSDLYRDSDGHVHLDFVVPLAGIRGGAQPPPAAVVLHAPVGRVLFPLVQSWPTPSPSAEALLVRRDGEAALYLNELRQLGAPPLTFRLPFRDNPEAPAVKALRSGQPQLQEGVDYRGVPVLFASQPVPGTSWYLIAKIDRDEVLAPLDNLIFWVSLVAFAAISALAAALLLLWQQMQRAHRLELSAQAAAIQYQSETKYRRLHQSMRDAFAMVDMAGNLVDFNLAFQEMLGYSAEELRRLTYFDLTPEKWHETEKRIIAEQVIPQGHSPVYEKEYRRKDGSVFPVELKASLILGENGEPEGIWAIVRNIAERKRADEALRLSERRFRHLFDNMLEGYAYCEMIFANGQPWDFTYLEVNQAFERLTGLRNVVGKKVSEVIPGIREKDPALFEIYGRVASTGSAEKFEFHLEALGIWFSLSAYCPEKGYFVAIFDNITERKQSEAAIRQLNAELESKVEERTAELKGINEEMKTFTYSVSHDLKAPLRGIDGYSRLLQEDYANRLDEEGRTFISNIRNGAQQMSQLIDDLLAYSRQERRTLRHTRVALGQVAEAVAAEFSGELRSRSVELRLAVPEIAAAVDVESLATILRNLLDNAIKFSRNSATPAIEIGGREEAHSAILWVRDNGIGFDMRFHDRIFEIFQRLQRAEDYPGTGIGLAIVRKAVQRMGGRAWAESVPGQGATFFVELPK